MYIEFDKRRNTYAVRGVDGNRKWDSCSWPTKSEAKLRMKFLLGQRTNNILGICKEVPLSEATDTFFRIHGPRLANDASRAVYRNQLNMLKRHFGNKMLSKITYQDVVSYWNDWISRGKKVSTANKHMMLLHCIFERFKFWNGMVPEIMPEKVALPELNPVAVAKEYLGRKRISTSHLGRKRRVSEIELRNAKAWCLENDPKLWDAIELAIWTALRKQDLKKLRNGYTVNLVQQKTGQEQVMPIPINNLPEFGNIRIRWDYLRGAMGWLKKDTPIHTTWHDLRHCAPSMLADGGFSSQVISQYLGHTNEKMSKQYTHPSGSLLIPAVKFVEERLKAL